MSKKSPDYTGDAVSQNDGPTLHVFVAFEDLNTRMEAWQLYRHLAEDLAKDLVLTSAFCNLDVLSDDDQGGEEVMKAAAEADLVFFSINTASRLSPGLKSWLECWVAKRQMEEGGLFLLIEHTFEDHAQPSAAQIYLRDVAHRAGMDFLSQIVPTPSASVMASGNHASGWASAGATRPEARQRAELSVGQVN